MPLSRRSSSGKSLQADKSRRYPRTRQYRDWTRRPDGHVAVRGRSRSRYAAKGPPARHGYARLTADRPRRQSDPSRPRGCRAISSPHTPRARRARRRLPGAMHRSPFFSLCEVCRTAEVTAAQRSFPSSPRARAWRARARRAHERVLPSFWYARCVALLRGQRTRVRISRTTAAPHVPRARARRARPQCPAIRWQNVVDSLYEPPHRKDPQVVEDREEALTDPTPETGVRCCDWPHT
jgi:hypothetical protein